MLFLYGIEGFSREAQAALGDRFRDVLGRYVKRPIHGIILGSMTTAIVQSSTATSVIAVALVNSGVVTFHQSLGIIIGTNIGTTLTAQLVAFKLTAFGSVFLVIGFIISLFKWRLAFLGKAVFYFGLVFFSLNQIAMAVEPFKEHPQVLEFIANARSPWVGLLIGALVTAVFQSSSVTTGLIVILVQSRIIDIDSGIPLVIGANIGTTITAGFAAIHMDVFAKRTALAHVIFNLGGALLILPFLPLIIAFLNTDLENPAHTLANVHLYFNIGATFFFWLFLKPFENLIVRLVPGRQDESQQITKFISDPPPKDANERALQIEDEAIHAFEILGRMAVEAADPSPTDQEDEIKQLRKKRFYLEFLGRSIRKSIDEFGERYEISPQLQKRLIISGRLVGLVEHAASGIELLSNSVYSLAEVKSEKSLEMTLTVAKVSDILKSLFSSLEERMRSRRSAKTGVTESALAELDNLINANYFIGTTLIKTNKKSENVFEIGPFCTYMVHLQGLVSDILEIRRLLIETYRL